MSLPAPAPVYYARRTRAYLADLWSRREFAWFLAMGNLRARNASTALGLFWWVLNPLLLALVYFLVFGVLLPSARDISYLMSGMFVFHFTSRALVGGASSIISSAKLIVNLKFPRLILPISLLLESSVGFLVSLLVFYAIVIPVNGVIPGFELLWIVVIFPIQLLFNLGLAALTARIAVPFRDVQNVLRYVNRLWLYLSPIIWTPDLLAGRAPDWVQNLIQWNPMYSIITVYRAALLGDPFSTLHLWRSVVWALLIGGMGVALFIKYENRMTRYL